MRENENEEVAFEVQWIGAAEISTEVDGRLDKELEVQEEAELPVFNENSGVLVVTLDDILDVEEPFASALMNR